MKTKEHFDRSLWKFNMLSSMFAEGSLFNYRTVTIMKNFKVFSAVYKTNVLIIQLGLEKSCSIVFAWERTCFILEGFFIFLL